MSVNLDEFFNFDVKEPINSLAYSQKDIDYKIKIIKKMQEMGMTITMDKIGNICGKLEFGPNPGEKTIAIGSHTDSVYNGGQYDGRLGVVNGLMVADRLKQSKDFNGTLLVCIYQCEESSRFGNACLGSKYLAGKISEDDFNTIFDQKALEDKKNISLSDCISEYSSKIQNQIPEIQVVDKIFEKVNYSLESHIEQYETLAKLSKKKKEPVIGIVTSVGSAVRIRYSVEGKSDHTGSTPMRKRRNPLDVTSDIQKAIRKYGKNLEKQGLGRASQLKISTPGHNSSFNQIPNFAEGEIDIRLLGENTPERAIEAFENIIQKTLSKKRNEGITVSYDILSQGTPVITDSSLNSQLEEIAVRLNIPYIMMPSYAGQDTGNVPADFETMVFGPSTGGSHNPEESTTRECVETTAKILENTTREILKQPFKDKLSVGEYSNTGITSDSQAVESQKSSINKIVEAR